MNWPFIALCAATIFNALAALFLVGQIRVMWSSLRQLKSLVSLHTHWINNATEMLTTISKPESEESDEA